MGTVLACLLLVGSVASGQVVGYAVPAATYYVDGARGSDTNTGGGPQSGKAFATLAKLQTVLTAGQLGAVSGNASNCAAPTAYREKITLPTGAALTGYGCKPLIDASDAISAGAWTKTGGYTNVYQATVTMENPGGTGFLSTWENGTRFQQVASLAALDSTAGRYYVASNGLLTGTSQTLYVHATDDSSPASNGKVYEFSARLYSVTSAVGSAVRVASVWTRRQLGNNGSFEIGVGSFASDIRADDGTKHNALMHEASYWQNITLTDSYYDSSKIALVLNDNSPTGLDATVVNATYTETFQLTGVGFYGHVNTSGGFGTVTLTNCRTVGAATSVSGFTAAQMVIDGGTYNAGITAGSTTNLLQNLTGAGAIGIPYAVPVTIRGVSLSGAFTNGAISVANNVGVAGALSIDTTTCSNSVAFDDCLYVGTGTTIPAFTFTNNTLLSPVQSNHIGGPGSANLPLASTINGNTYHYPGAGTPSWIVFRGTTYALNSAPNWAAWQGLGFDATGSRVTP